MRCGPFGCMCCVACLSYNVGRHDRTFRAYLQFVLLMHYASSPAAAHKIASIELFNLLSPLDRHNIVKYEWKLERLSSARRHFGRWWKRSREEIISRNSKIGFLPPLVVLIYASLSPSSATQAHSISDKRARVSETMTLNDERCFTSTLAIYF